MDADKDGRSALAVIGRPRSSLFHDRAVRERAAASTHTTFTECRRDHGYAPIQMHNVIKSAKFKKEKLPKYKAEINIVADGPA